MPPVEVRPLPVIPESTYKAREVEGILDLYFYRKIGFQLALLFARLGLSPSAVTFIGGVFGVLAGHFYYYRDLRINILGMALHVCANAFDNADGQLARLTNQTSRRGRITDSLVDHIIFFSIYLHLTLRCLHEGASPWIWLLASAAGASHALQAVAADYCRNAYLHFAKAKSRTSLDSYSSLRRDYEDLDWSRHPWDKFLLALYRNATWQQETLSPGLKQLHDRMALQFARHDSDSWPDHYGDAIRPTFRLWGFLMTNSRMLFLFLFLAIDRPAWFFWLELTLFNALFIFLIWQQEIKSRSLLRLLTTEIRGED
jgi:phosphatidylglycerophosphate synthase